MTFRRTERNHGGDRCGRHTRPTAGADMGIGSIAAHPGTTGNHPGEKARAKAVPGSVPRTGTSTRALPRKSPPSRPQVTRRRPWLNAVLRGWHSEPPARPGSGGCSFLSAYPRCPVKGLKRLQASVRRAQLQRPGGVIRSARTRRSIRLLRVPDQHALPGVGGGQLPPVGIEGELVEPDGRGW